MCVLSKDSCHLYRTYLHASGDTYIHKYVSSKPVSLVVMLHNIYIFTCLLILITSILSCVCTKILYACSLWIYVRMY